MATGYQHLSLRVQIESPGTVISGLMALAGGIQIAAWNDTTHVSPVGMLGIVVAWMQVALGMAYLLRSSRVGEWYSRSFLSVIPILRDPHDRGQMPGHPSPGTGDEVADEEINASSLSGLADILPEAQRKLLNVLTDNVDTEMSRSVKSVILCADEMSQSAFAMLMQFGDMRERSNGLVESSHVGRTSIEGLSSETGQLVSAMARIDRETEDTREALRTAIEVLTRVARERDRLLASATEISTIVELIGSIAHRTNMLAINATIEAARAGEAGKGFIVVADEVKNLARRAAAASSEVSQKIDAVRRSTGSISEVLHELEGTVGTVDRQTLGIAEVVDEQRGVVDRIGDETRNLSDLINAVVDSASLACDALSVSEESAQAIQKDCLAMTESVHDLRNNLTQILRGSAVGNRRVYERIDVLLPVEVRRGMDRYETDAVDLSLFGAALARPSGRNDFDLAVGDRIIVKLPLDQTMEATVRRSSFEKTGVEFDGQIGKFDELIAMGRKNADANTVRPEVTAAQDTEEDDALLWG